MKTRKRTILIFSLSRKPWIGGIYYRKNIINLLLSSEVISTNFNIVLVVNEKNKEIFEVFNKRITIISCKDNIGPIQACVIGFKCAIKYDIRYVFPIKPYSLFKLTKITPISWIADFQHCYYPDFFEKSELNERNKNFSIIANSNNPLVLSSNTCKSDLLSFFNPNRKNVYVVPFTSFINDELKKITEIKEEEVFKKYNIQRNNYIAICNQFWKHKNHKVVFEAINSMKHTNKTTFVFTGELSDRRNPDYINELKEFINNNGISNHIVITGFIDRIDQLIIMKNSMFIIQPSLFEGWGTVVEDSKVLNKTVLLSDIPVHREQANKNCILFNPCDKNDLVNKIDYLLKNKNINYSFDDRTHEYAKKMETIFINEK